MHYSHILKSGCVAGLWLLSVSLVFSANTIRSYRVELDAPLSETDISGIETQKRWPNLPVGLMPAATPEVFASLGKLPELRKLRIEGNEHISDLAPLSALPRLESLSVRVLRKAKETPLSLAPLAGCPELTEVDFYGTPVTDVGTLAACTKLQALELYMSNVDSIDFLAHTPKITDLNLYGDGHTFPNYEPVAKLAKLRELDIYLNKQATDANLSVLKTLTALSSIHLTGCREVSSLDFLSNCTELERLRANWCPKLADIKALAGMPKLTQIELSQAPIVDIAPLSGKAELLKLDLSETKISDLSPLLGSTKLKELNLSKTPMKDLTPLSGMAALDTLELKQTSVSDLKPLAGLSKLTTLELEGTPVTDLSPLHKLTGLKRIILSRATLGSQIEALKAALPNLRVELR